MQSEVDSLLLQQRNGIGRQAESRPESDLKKLDDLLMDILSQDKDPIKPP